MVCQLGRSGLHVAPLASGTNVFGWTVDEPTAFRLLDAFVDAGFNLIDTADVYSTWVPGNRGGESETIIGRWFRYESLQPRYNLAERASFEDDLAPLCVERGVGVIPYFALARGFLTGKYRTEADLPKSPRGPGVTVPIASATSLEQLNDLMAAARLDLDEASVERLDRASR